MKTGDLFTSRVLTPPRILDLREDVAGLLSKSLKEFPADRYSASAEISRVAGYSISKCALDSWTAQSHERHNMPAWAVPAVEIALNTRAITSFLVRQSGGEAVFGADVVSAEIGRLERQRDQLSERIVTLKKGRK